jgi:hypothetical protein
LAESPELQDQLAIQYAGMTVGEVMMAKLAITAARGSLPAIKMMLEYTLGRPVQQIESKSMRMNYQDYLAEMANNDPGATTIVAHEPSERPDPGGLDF